MLDIKNHPIVFLQKFIKEFCLDTAEFEYSLYISGGRGRTLSRKVCKIKGVDISNDWFLKELSSLKEGQEFAWHSSVYKLGDHFHIPMADFQETYKIDNLNPLIKKFLKTFKSSVHIYNSGRSSHSYMFSLLNESEWYSYLGALLLLNPFDSFDPQVIDSRWVGHSLEHGFSALRWSKNTDLYFQLPSLQEIIEG